MLKAVLALVFGSFALCAQADPASAPVTDMYSDFYLGKDDFRLAPRVALVIGIAKVQDDSGFEPLDNPVNDADDVASVLRRLGFTVYAPHENYPSERLTRQIIKKALYDFAEKLQQFGGVGLIYFSGHGVERNHQTYLVPYDGYIRYARDLDEELIPMSMFYEAFGFAGNRLNFLFLDSCRDFPSEGIPDSFGSSAKLPAPLLTSPYVVRENSTLSGGVALDGSEKVSPFAKAFLESLQIPDIHLLQFFDTIGDKLTASGGTGQTPVLELPGAHDFVFHPTEKTFKLEQSEFNTGEREILQQLTNKYAGGYFYKAAQNRLDHAPLVPPPLPPVALSATTTLRAAPGFQAQIVGLRFAGAVLRVAGAPKTAAGESWIPVVHPSTGETAYVKEALVSPALLESSTVNVDFEARNADSVQTLSQSSLNALRESTNKQSVAGIARVEVLGFNFKQAEQIGGTSQQLLARQAAVVQALKDAGVNPAKIIIPNAREAVSTSLDHAVQLKFVTEK